MVDKERIFSLEKDEITEQENIMDLFSDSEGSAEWAQVQVWLLERAKAIKCTAAVRTLIAGIKAKVKEDGGVKQPGNSEYIYDGAGDGTVTIFDCGAWFVKESGITQKTIIGEIRASHNLILPVRRLVNIETGEEKLELAIRRDGDWKHTILDRATIASAKDIYKPLASIGAGVTSESAKHLVRFLAEVEAANDLPKETSSSKLGWHGEKFIPFDSGIVFDATKDFKEMSESLDQHGDRQKWLDIVLEVRRMGRYEPVVCMAAAFASIMVGKLNMLPFVVNLWGDTSGGKTVMLMMACSIWANPAESKYITDAHCTLNAIEARLDALNDLPLLMDDLSKASNKMGDKDFATLIYLLCSGRGKSRSNVKITLNTVKTWNSITLSNMERPLATDSMQGGAINRVLDIEMAEGKVFNQRMGNKVATTVKANYGFAGVEFIDVVHNVGWKKIKEMKEDFYRQIAEEAERQGQVKEDKQMDPLALILTADKLTVDYIYQDEQYLDLPLMVSMLKDFGQIGEGQRGYEYIMAFHDENYAAFHVDEMRDGSQYTGREFGFVDGGYLYVNPNVMTRVSADGNFSKKAFCRWARRNDLLLTNDSDTNRDTCVKKKGGVSQRYYAIKMPMDTPTSEETAQAAQDVGFTDVDDMQELPFD